MFDDSDSRKVSLLNYLMNIGLENCDSLTPYVTQIVKARLRIPGTCCKITSIEYYGIGLSAGAIKIKILDMCSEIGLI